MSDPEKSMSLLDFYGLYKIGNVKIFYLIVIFLIFYVLERYYFHCGNIFILIIMIAVILILV